MQSQVANLNRQNSAIKDSVQTVGQALQTVGADIICNVDHLEEGGLIGFCLAAFLYLVMFICWYPARATSNAIPTTIASDNQPNPALHQSQRFSSVYYIVSKILEPLSS